MNESGNDRQMNLDRHQPDSTQSLLKFTRRLIFRRIAGLFLLAFAVIGFSRPAFAAIAFVQSNNNTLDPSNTISIRYTQAQQAGDLNVVIVGFGNSTGTITSVTDSSGNIYTPVTAPTTSAGNATVLMYYAKNIVAAAANANAVMVSFNTSVFAADIRIAEYSGIDTAHPFDVAKGASGSGTSMSSGTVTTTNATDLLVGGNFIWANTNSIGAGYTQRELTAYSHILEDRVVTSTGSYDASATQDDSGFWVMQVAAFKASGASGGDTTAPSAPTSLTTTAVNATLSTINLSWTASTDNVGVTGYRVERCAGSGCSNFVEVANPIGTSYSDIGLSASTAYTYRVRATDAAGNVSTYSSTASATTPAATITLVQSTWNTGGSPPTIGAALYSPQNAGDLIVVIIGWADSTSNVVSVTDQVGNTYVRALGPTVNSGNATESIYYAKNIIGSTNPNGITVTFDNANIVNADLRIGEYHGVDTVNPLDAAIGGVGSGTSLSSGSLTTTNANDLLVAGNFVEDVTTSMDANYWQRQFSDGAQFLSDRLVSSTGSYSITATQGNCCFWILQLVAFKAASGGSDTQPPTAPTNLSATAASGTQINLSWTASTDNVGVTGYKVERCSGSGCSNFAQVATPTGTTYSDTGLTSSTSYSYRVRATDAAGNLSSYSSTASATTQDTTPPSAPTNLSATAASSSQINLSWTASTDNVGVTGYKVERCSGSGCSNFAQVATPTGTTYSDTGLTASTSYSYRVRATDAAGNLSSYSSTASATTQAGSDTTPPSAPTNLSATAASSTQINLTWTASTDNVGVTGYIVKSCSGASCTPTTQIATPTTTSYSNTGLTASTTYRYQVFAKDAAGNVSTGSSIVSATTQAPPDTTPPSAPTNLSATTASGTQINLSWTASTDNVGVTGYKVERCQGSGCSNFAQIATPTGTTFSDTGLTSSTSYSYRVRATDAAGNLSGYSNTASATTQDTTAPSAPSALSATAASGTQINLSWTASTDNVGVTGYKIERCSGSGCSNFAQISTPTGTTFSDTGLSPATSYSYRVRATDAAGNLSGYSNTASATTQTPPQPPTALNVTAASNKELDISWTASTSSGVTGYLIERCQGASCSNFAQLGSSTPNLFLYDAGLTANTSYSYRIRAVDGSGNTSAYSSVLTGSTLATASCD